MLTATDLFKCLADETRLRALSLITRRGELCVCELSHALATIQPKVSRHLAQLRALDLVEDERRGQWVYYRLHPKLPDWARQMIELAAEVHDGAREQRRLDTMPNRPQRC
jgi:ArsR family transcriptional regulator